MPQRSRFCEFLQNFCYGLGHIYNDLCATMWFSYTLFYLQVVQQINSKTAGLLLMLGQIIDALSTPLVGWAIDYIGHKQRWHLFGTLCVSIGFSLIFSLKTTQIDSLTIWYYCSVIGLFQIGWAIVQISHLAIIPDIARNHDQSSNLTIFRYIASVCCSIIVYIIALLILQSDEENNIGPMDFYKFKKIALIMTFVGLLTSMLFYCGLLSISDEDNYETILSNNTIRTETVSSQVNFLQNSIIYLVSILYVASRLFTTLNLIYIPLYINERNENGTNNSINEGDREGIASFPLVCYVASFLTAFFLKFQTSKLELTYLISTIVGLLASIWISIGISSNAQLYTVAILLGTSGSATLIVSLCLTAQFVKNNGYGGGLVYSTVTFTDKLISGIVVLLIQAGRCESIELCPNYYQHVLSYICGGASSVGFLAIVLLKCQNKN